MNLEIDKYKEWLEQKKLATPILHKFCRNITNSALESPPHLITQWNALYDLVLSGLSKQSESRGIWILSDSQIMKTTIINCLAFSAIQKVSTSLNYQNLAVVLSFDLGDLSTGAQNKEAIDKLSLMLDELYDIEDAIFILKNPNFLSFEENDIIINKIQDLIKITGNTVLMISDEDVLGKISEKPKLKPFESFIKVKLGEINLEDYLRIQKNFLPLITDVYGTTFSESNRRTILVLCRTLFPEEPLLDKSLAIASELGQENLDSEVNEEKIFQFFSKKTSLNLHSVKGKKRAFLQRKIKKPFSFVGEEELKRENISDAHILQNTSAGPNSLQEKLDLVAKTKVKTLLLSELDLLEIPPEVEHFTWLENLFLSFNSIVDIDVISKLTNLRKLDLRGNRIREIKALENLENLVFLDLDSNQLSKVIHLNKLTKLEQLFVSHNYIDCLDGIENLKKIQSLDLSYNRIQELSQLEKLQELKSLKIFNNDIQNIEPLAKLNQLELLFAHSNKIRNINAWNSLSKLKRATIGQNLIESIEPLLSQIRRNGLQLRKNEDKMANAENNPLKTPPPEIVAMGNKGILSYFNEVDLQGADKLYEAKLLILGEGGVGKTSLYRKIIDINNELPAENETTFGIDIHKIPFMKVDNEKVFNLNIWDFGGQEIYHSTHQFFLTHRSLYVLVDDTRKDDKNVHDSSFSYWLQVVELLGGDSPLIIIQNEKGDRSKQIDLKSMQARFSFIKECKATNLLTGRGLEDILSSMKYWLQQLSHVGEVLPIQWIRIREEIEKISRQRDFISIYEYLTICEEYQISGEKRALNLSRYLHDLGVFLHFQDDKILENIIILRNNWATDAVYYILDDEKIKSKGGFFTNTDLERLWCEKRYKRHHSTLLALMKKFEISYELDNQKEQTWLATQMLPVAEPSLEWNEAETTVVKYRYNFMPKGIMSRLTVRMNRYISNTNYAWRSGVLLERKESIAMIKETFAGRELVIQAKGFLANELITIITEELDNLNESFINVSVDKLIPCNCHKCQSSTDVHYFNYENLMKRIQRGKFSVECEISYDDVEVKTLISDLFVNIAPKKFEEMKTFISYSEQDRELLDKLLKHLSGLKITNNLITWTEKEVLPGEQTSEKIKDSIATADIILFLISADFISSQRVWEKEIPLALKRQEKQEAVVIPIFLRPCDTTGLEFMQFQGLPKNPVTSYDNMDEAFTEISKGIRRSLRELKRY